MHARLLLCHVEVLQHIAVVWNVSQLHGAIHAAAAQSVLFFFLTLLPHQICITAMQ